MIITERKECTTAGITVEQVAERLLTGGEVLHISSLAGRKLWWGTRQEFQEGGVDEDGESVERFRGLQVRAVGATWDPARNSAAVLVTVKDPGPDGREGGQA